MCLCLCIYKHMRGVYASVPSMLADMYVYMYVHIGIRVYI